MTDAAKTPTTRSFWSMRIILILLVVLGAVGFLVVKGLRGATVYFHTADEAVAMRQSLEGKRFRMEGTVVPGSVRTHDSMVNFAISSNGVNVNVRNNGQPAGVFQENIPVVVEGRFQRGTNEFYSDQVMVRHSENYEAKHPDRVSKIPVQ